MEGRTEEGREGGMEEDRVTASVDLLSGRERERVRKREIGGTHQSILQCQQLLAHVSHLILQLQLHSCHLSLNLKVNKEAGKTVHCLHV